MDQYNYHPAACFGESLWDLLPSGKKAGGAPMNVAYHLHKQQKNPAVISKVGFDELGKQLIETLENKGVCTDYFQMDYNKPTGVAKGVSKGDLEMVFSIEQDVAWDYIETSTDIVPLVQSADYFVFGSLAGRSQKSFNTLLNLLEIAQIKVFDLNLRSPFYNRASLEVLLQKADIVKVSLDELELITGWFSLLSDETDRLKLLKDRFDLQALMLTRGGNGAMLNIKNEWRKCRGLRVRVADTVGCGDAFLAAFISQQLEGRSIDETLDYANRLAAFIATKDGACPDYTLEEVNEFVALSPT